MEEEAHGLLLLDGAVMLGFALAAVLLFRRFGLGATLGYLIAGVLAVSESALRMARRALARGGLSEEAIDRAEATYRGYERDRLAVQMETGDIYAAQDMTREQLHTQRDD